jgi:hypothetical protein
LTSVIILFSACSNDTILCVTTLKNPKTLLLTSVNPMVLAIISNSPFIGADASVIPNTSFLTFNG